jgi:hypothetical protein
VRNAKEKICGGTMRSGDKPKCPAGFRRRESPGFERSVSLLWAKPVDKPAAQEENNLPNFIQLCVDLLDRRMTYQAGMIVLKYVKFRGPKHSSLF